jgi:hypothetical protein
VCMTGCGNEKFSLNEAQSGDEAKSEMKLSQESQEVKLSQETEGPHLSVTVQKRRASAMQRQGRTMILLTCNLRTLGVRERLCMCIYV